MQKLTYALLRLANIYVKNRVEIQEISVSIGFKKHSVGMPQDAFHVVVRVRPINKIEKEKNVEEVVQPVEEHVVVVSAPALSKEDVLRQNRSRYSSAVTNILLTRNREKKFAFDHVFGSQSTQQEVFTHTTQDVISDVLQGYNATIFAYGPTGSGKTYSKFRF